MSLKSKTTEGVFWSGIFQVVKYILQFVITVILVRYISPSDFGIIGMVTVFTELITVFNEMGLTAAIIQKKDINHKALSSMFFLNLGVGLFLTLVTISLSSLIAQFYKTEILRVVTIFISFNFILGALAIVQHALFQKELEFKKLAIIDTVSLILGGSIGILLAYNGYGVWSLVFKAQAFLFFRVIFLWSISKFKPSFIFSWKEIKSYLSFSFEVLGFNIINYLRGNIDYLLVGKFLGATSLGYYTLGFKLMLYPIKSISSVIIQVLFPAFSIIQDNKSKIRKAYLKVVQSMTFIIYPIMLGLFAVAPEFVLTAYGKQWGPSIFIIRVLCLAGMCCATNASVVTIYLSTGRPDIRLKWIMVTTPLTGIAIIIGLNWGINGVAVAYSSAELLFWLFSHAIANRLIDLKMKDFLSSLVPTFLISSVMMTVILGFRYIQGSILILSDFRLLIISIILGIFSYLFLMKFFRGKMFDELIGMLTEQLNFKILKKKER